LKDLPGESRKWRTSNHPRLCYSERDDANRGGDNWNSKRCISFAPTCTGWSVILLSILMAIFPGGPGLAVTRMPPFWMLFELRMMEVVATTGAIRMMEVVATTGAIRRAKLKPNRHRQRTNICQRTNI